jgi:hypothetical protein
MDHLDLSDICSISQSCKGFLEMSCGGVSRLCCPLSSRSRPGEAYARLREFLLRRCDQGMEVYPLSPTASCPEACCPSLLNPMFCSTPVNAVMLCQLEELHLIGYACQTHPPPGSLVRLFHQLQQALAPALTTLFLGNLRHLDIHNKDALLVSAQHPCLSLQNVVGLHLISWLRTCQKPQKTAGHHINAAKSTLPSMLHDGFILLQAGVSACSRLRHLVLCTWMAPPYWLEESGFESLPESTGYPKLDWGLVKALSKALPGLAALEFHTGDHPCFDYQPPAPVNTATDPEPGSWESLPRCKRAGLPFDPDFVKSIVQSESAGLQLLQVQRGYELAQEDFIHLPATLRYLSTPCR